VPLAITAGVLCLVIGVGLGIGAMMYWGYKWEREPVESAGGPAGPGASGGPGKGGFGPPGKGGFGGKGKGGKGAGKGAPKGGGGPKADLISLVDKLDLATRKPLSLTDEQRKKVRAQLDALADTEKLSNEEAQKRLDALLDVLKGQKEALEAVGFRWPGEAAKMPSGFNPEMAPNPLRVEQPGEHLKALQKRLAEGPS
jgi:hypothetical protein